MKTQQVCYDRKEIERGLIKFVTNVKSEDSTIVCYDRREIERGLIKFVTNVKSEDSAIVL